MKNLSVLFTFLFTLLLVISIEAQKLPESCKLGLLNAPNLRGIKLGMLSKDVEKTLNLKMTLEDYKPALSGENLQGGRPLELYKIGTDFHFQKISVGVVHSDRYFAFSIRKTTYISGNPIE